MLHIMFRPYRKFIAVLLAIWLPLFSGSALAASVAMQTMGGDCPAATAQANEPNAHHHDQSSANQDQSSGQHDQQSSVCQDCGICHFACGGYLAAIAIKATEARPSAITYASFSTQFQSFTSAPLDPPPLSRV